MNRKEWARRDSNSRPIPKRRAGFQDSAANSGAVEIVRRKPATNPLPNTNHHVKLSWLSSSRFMSFVPGSATPKSSPTSTICRSPMTTSQKRCIIRCSILQKNPAKRRKPKTARSRRLLFYRVFRRIAKICE